MAVAQLRAARNRHVKSAVDASLGVTQGRTLPSETLTVSVWRPSVVATWEDDPEKGKRQGHCAEQACRATVHVLRRQEEDYAANRILTKRGDQRQNRYSLGDDPYVMVGAVVCRAFWARSRGRLDDWQAATRMGLAVMFVFLRVAHFANAQHDLIRMVPPRFPIVTLVTLTGVAELAGAAGLAIPSTAKWAAYRLMVLLIAMFPANIAAPDRSHYCGRPRRAWLCSFRFNCSGSACCGGRSAG